MLVSLRLKILILLAVLAASSMLSFGLYSYSRSKALLLQDAMNAVQDQVRTIGNTAGRSFARNAAHQVRVLSQSPSVLARMRGDRDEDGFLAEWALFRRLNPHVWRIYMADRSGAMAFHSPDSPPEGYSPLERPWYRDAISRPGSVVWTGPYKDAVIGKPMTSVETTISDPATGAALGVFSMDVSMEGLELALSTVSLPAGSGLFILNREGDIVAASAGARAMVSEIGTHWLRKALAPGTDVILREGGRSLFLSVTDMGVPEWKLLLLVPRDEILQRAKPLRTSAFVASSLVMAAAGALLVLLFRHIDGRVRRLTRYMTEVAAGSTDLLTLFSGRDEFSIINTRFNEMVHAWREAEADLARTEQSYRRTFQDAPLGIFRSIPEGRFLSMNAEGARMLGYDTPEETMASISDLVEDLYVNPADRVRFLGELERHGSVKDFQVEFRRKDGSTVWVSLCARLVNEDQRFIEGFITDVSERIRDKERLELLATKDDLTGAWNRRHFMDILQREIPRAQRYGHALSVLMLDADHFKVINDRHGHLAGDRVLQHIVETLLTGVREVDTLARIGGEEFALLLPETGHAEALELAERLRATLAAEPAPWPDGPIPCTVSIGVATVSEQVGDADTLLQIADIRLYEAKSAGRNRVR